jgi:hypothetical protein
MCAHWFYYSLLYERRSTVPRICESKCGGHGGSCGVSHSLSAKEYRARICQLLRSPRINSKESIPPACVAWRAGTTTLFLLGS